MARPQSEVTVAVVQAALAKIESTLFKLYSCSTDRDRRAYRWEATPEPVSVIVGPKENDGLRC